MRILRSITRSLWTILQDEVQHWKAILNFQRKFPIWFENLYPAVKKQKNYLFLCLRCDSNDATQAAKVYLFTPDFVISKIYFVQQRKGAFNFVSISHAKSAAEVKSVSSAEPFLAKSWNQFRQSETNFGSSIWSRTLCSIHVSKETLFQHFCNIEATDVLWKIVLVWYLLTSNMAEIGGNLLRSWTKDVRLLSSSSGNSLEPEMETRRRWGAYATKMDEEMAAALVDTRRRSRYTLEEIGW